MHPFSMIIAGPSSAGKTEFVLRLLKYAKQLISPEIEKIYWCYGEYQDRFEEFENIELIEGLPNPTLFNRAVNNLVIIDDLMNEMDERVSQLFTRGSHHRNTSVILILQNIFSKNKHMRTISLNSHYLVLFKNPRDKSQISRLASQMYPNRGKYMLESFKDATSTPFGYLMIDLTQKTPDHLRLRTNIFPGETQFVYIQK